MSARPISLDNDYPFRIEVPRTNGATGLREPATGLTGMTAHVSLIDGGGPISLALRATLVEASGDPGTYLGQLEGDVLRAEHDAGRLPLGRVWIVSGNGVDVRVSEPTVVQAIRRPL